jgi:hypothetical protein
MTFAAFRLRSGRVTFAAFRLRELSGVRLESSSIPASNHPNAVRDVLALVPELPLAATAVVVESVALLISTVDESSFWLSPISRRERRSRPHAEECSPTCPIAQSRAAEAPSWPPTTGVESKERS